MKEIKRIFPTPIMEFMFDKELSDKVYDFFLPLLPKLKPNTDGNPIATDFFSERIVKPDEFLEFFNKLVECCQEYSNATGYAKGYRMNYWVQDYKPGGIHKRHNHGASHVSGVYWIRSKGQPGPLMLENPNPNLYVTEQIVENYHTEFTDQKHMIIPEQGKLVLFPSHIFHEVMPSEGDVERTVFAFNMDP